MQNMASCAVMVVYVDEHAAKMATSEGAFGNARNRCYHLLQRRSTWLTLCRRVSLLRVACFVANVSFCFDIYEEDDIHNTMCTCQQNKSNESFSQISKNSTMLTERQNSLYCKTTNHINASNLVSRLDITKSHNHSTIN